MARKRYDENSGHGHGAGEGAILRRQVARGRLRQGLVQTGAFLQRRVQQQARHETRLDPDVGVGVVGDRARRGFTTRTARLFSDATATRGGAFALGRPPAHTDT